MARIALDPEFGVIAECDALGQQRHSASPCRRLVITVDVVKPQPADLIHEPRAGRPWWNGDGCIVIRVGPALPLYGKTTFARTTLNPQQLLDTKTLGISASDVTVTIAYRYGGGLNHNVEPNTIRVVSSLSMRFPTT